MTNPEPTCTVVTGPGQTCGAPAVQTFTSRNGQRTYHECADHALPIPADLAQPVEAPHPPTRTTRPYVLVRDGVIVGYAETASARVADRARRLGARIVKVTR